MGQMKAQDISHLIEESAQNINSAVRIVNALAGIPPGIRDELSCVAKEHKRLVNAFNTAVSGDLSLPILIPLGIGAVALISALGAWALKHRYETQEIKERVSFFEKLKQSGVDPEEASRRASGQYSPIAEGIGKLTVLALVLGCIYIIVKVV